MAVLSDHGKHCSVDVCRQRDFLPFTCDLCERVFCLQHFRYADHACPKAEGKDNRVLVCPLCQKGVRILPEENPNATWERHAASTDCRKDIPHRKTKCPVPGCRQQLTAITSFHCKACGRTVCMAHRFEDAHRCPMAVAPRSVARPGNVASFAAGSTASSIWSGLSNAWSAAASGVTSAAQAFISSAPSRGWTCARCTLENTVESAECAACGAAKPPVDSWQCRRCTFINTEAAHQCDACGDHR